MSKIVATIAVLMLALGATASAQTPQDYRSPDAKGGSVQQDYRSPDARSVQSGPSVQDLRSPDARGSGRFQPSVPTENVSASDPFQWGYMALAIAAALASLAGFVIVQRRRRHGLAIGS
jgi:hypothetical protein